MNPLTQFMRRHKQFGRSVSVSTKTFGPKLAPSTKTLHVASRHYLFGISGWLSLCSALLVLSIGAALLGAPLATQGDPVNFVSTGSLAMARIEHTKTLLPNGKVLVTGGSGTSGFLASAELYDPASGTWSATGSLATARGGHTATLLPNGKVLVAGGYVSVGDPYGNDFEITFFASAELYDPATGTWSATGSLATARDYHTATLLPNGKVLVAGGFGTNGFLASAELYDPGSGSWSATGSLATARSGHTATLLPNGKVLVAGGQRIFIGGELASAELYDPASGSWSATDSLATARRGHTATLLPNGEVLVAGGTEGSSFPASAELYDPASGTWSATGSLATGRFLPTGTLLPNGKVLVAGGADGHSILASAELYDPASGTWSATGNLVTARSGHTATLLRNGKVLIAAGGGNSGILASAELYNTNTPAGRLFNISTRGFVQTGDNVLIGGFIVTGAGSKKVIIRAIGPSLGRFGIQAALQDPILELHGKNGVLITSNDNWKQTQQAAIQATGIPPSDDRESAIVATLAAQSSGYSAIVRGKNGTTGVALVEVYDLDPAANSKLANISTRGRVETGENVMIGGFIVGGATQVLVRGIGPSLTKAGVPGALQDPTLELHNQQGTLIGANDNWKTTQQAAIQATGIPPTDDRESAILVTLSPGPNTAILRGKNSTTGVGLVEVFNLH